MFDSREGVKLWRKIGISGQGAEEVRERVEEEARSKTSRSSVYSSMGWEEPDKIKQKTTPASISVLEQPPFAPPSMSLRRSTQQHLWQEVQNQPPTRMAILQEESHIQQLIQLRQEKSHLNSIDYEDLEAYNEEISNMPESVTPLVYSKNSRKDDVRFSKQTAKAIILKIRLTEAKDLLHKMRQEFLEFSFKIKEEHENLQREVCGKYFQMAREQSLRIQQSVFMHKQDCQQLKYELQVIKNKEDFMRYPIESELIFNNNTSANQFKQENEDLKAQIAKIIEQNSRLVRQGENFKRKISQIEAKTLQIRQSNDKLYEYIFDLQQKMAYYQEEIPKISSRVREQTEKRMERQHEEQNLAHYEEMTRNMDQLEMLQGENMKLNQQIKKSNEFITQFEKQNIQIKTKLERVEEELKIKQVQIQNKSKQVLTQQSDNKKLKCQVQKLVKEKQQIESWKQEQRRQSNSRLSRAYSSKQDKKLIEALQIEKLVLQKENIQLKATIQFYNKNQNYTPPSYIPQRPYSTVSYDMPTNIQSQQQIDLRDRQLEMKQKELISLQNYLQDQAKRLQSKQRDVQAQYVLKKAQETRLREYIQPTRIMPIDDYGMKKLPITQAKPLQQQRKNHFCSSQTQAIIQKVKMRQKMKENGVCACNQTRNCHCQALSRGSRTSQDSNSREYLRMQQHRPSNYSPGMGGYQYLKRQQKSSKMKLIQDKVRRLKSELKSSFTTMNS